MGRDEKVEAFIRSLLNTDETKAMIKEFVLDYLENIECVNLQDDVVSKMSTELHEEFVDELASSGIGMLGDQISYRVDEMEFMEWYSNNEEVYGFLPLPDGYPTSNLEEITDGML